MKKIIAILRSYLGHAGAYFMFTILGFSLIFAGAQATQFDMQLVWVALLFAALVAFCDFIFAAKFIGSYFVKVLCHGILSVTSFAIAFSRYPAFVNGAKTLFFATFFFALFYIILAVIRCSYRFVAARKENKQKQYNHLYTPKNIDH